MLNGSPRRFAARDDGFSRCPKVIHAPILKHDRFG